MNRKPIPPERAQRVEEIYHAALEREMGQRAAFLAEACVGDEALLREVASLVSAHGKAGDFIEGFPRQIAAEVLDMEWAQSMSGRRIGRYQLVSLLGAGGMGRVYRAPGHASRSRYRNQN